MSEISFDEEPEYVGRPREVRQSLLIRLVFATGLVKTDQQANRVLIIIAVVAVLLAFIAPSLIAPTPHLTPEQQAFINANPPPRH